MTLQGLSQPLELIRIGTHDLEIILHTTLFSYHDMEVLYFS